VSAGLRLTYTGGAVSTIKHKRTWSRAPEVRAASPIAVSRRCETGNGRP